MEKIKVGILGATGMVGQRFVELLQDHPWFKITELVASERSAGNRYKEALGGRWSVSGKIPENLANIKVKECKPNLDCKIVFSALDSSVAGPIEEEFAKNGYAVFSNSKNHRMDDDVPLLIPEVNVGHLSILKKQKERFGKGFIVTNPNCSTIGLVMALKPLDDNFGLKRIFVTTMQALSGAGLAGLRLDIDDNVIPYIGGEEEKIETEPLKLLGNIKDNKFSFADIKISAQCNRVNVKDGHLEAVNVELDKKADLGQIKDAFKEFNPLKKLKLPSAPDPPIIIKGEVDRPQPKHDRDSGNGMAVTVGRIRKCNILDYRFMVLSHNTIRGAAGASILNAELMKVEGYIE